MQHSLEKIQSLLKEFGLDAWFLYDFRDSNSVAWNLLGVAADTHCTRRWMVIIPAIGKPVKIVHAIEAHTLSAVDATEIRYSSRFEWANAIESFFPKCKRIAMEYSPNNDIPVIAKVDAGTIEWLRSLGAEIHSSSNLVSAFAATLTESQISENLKTAKLLRAAMFHGFAFIRESLLAEKPVTEYAVQQEILQFFEQNGLITDFPPIVAVNANAANPHYAPTEAEYSPIQRGDLILVDMWAKTPNSDSVFADITWMAFAGDSIPEEYSSVFAVIARARDAVVEYLRNHFAKDSIPAYVLDDIARHIIRHAGHGAYFFHRTGHSITTEIHGAGANLDNFETHDTRKILPATSFSVEPGIYFTGKFGMRTELDVVITEKGEILVPTEPTQSQILPLLAEHWRCE